MDLRKIKAGISKKALSSRVSGQTAAEKDVLQELHTKLPYFIRRFHQAGIGGADLTWALTGQPELHSTGTIIDLHSLLTDDNAL